MINYYEVYNDEQQGILDDLVADMYDNPTLSADVAALLLGKSYSDGNADRMKSLDKMFPDKKLLTAYMLNEWADMAYGYYRDI